MIVRRISFPETLFTDMPRAGLLLPGDCALALINSLMPASNGRRVLSAIIACSATVTFVMVARISTHQGDGTSATAQRHRRQASLVRVIERAASPNPAESAVAPNPAESAVAKLLDRGDILQRIPPGKLAFFTLANAAYGDLAVNWALLLGNVLRPIGAESHYFVGALDANISASLLARGLPTMRAGLSGAHDGAADAPSTNFRLQFSKFRAYGVTKADLIAWLLGAGRDVVVSDVDCAWLSPPHFLLGTLPEADLMAGTDCLHVDSDDDRSTRGDAAPRCGHHPGSHWAAWFNTGVLLFRAKSEHALSFAVRWRDAMAAVRWPLQRGVGRAASPSLAAGIGWTCVLLVARVYTSDFARPPPPTAHRRCKATAALATKSTTSSPSTSSSNGTAHSATALRATPTQSVPHVPTEGSYLMRRARGRSHRCLPARSAQVTSSTYNSQSSGEGAL